MPRGETGWKTWTTPGIALLQLAAPQCGGRGGEPGEGDAPGGDVAPVADTGRAADGTAPGRADGAGARDTASDTVADVAGDARAADQGATADSDRETTACEPDCASWIAAPMAAAGS